MDEGALAGAEQDVTAWGLLEQTAEGPTWTRRFRGAVMREASRLAEEERAGRKPAGNPLENAVQGALRTFPLPPGAAATRLHERYLVAVELAALPESVRNLLGG